MPGLNLTSPAFADGGVIPLRYTGHAEDLSPPLHLEGLDETARSLCVVMDDLDIPLLSPYAHWLLWNLPPCGEIPEAVPHGPRPEGLDGAVQGVGYGKHRYRGPKPPFRSSHRYRFTVYALDCLLDLPAETRQRQLLRALQGHVLQSASLTGRYR